MMILRVAIWGVVILFPASEIVLARLKRASSGVAYVHDRGSMRLLWLVIITSVCIAIACQWVSAARLHVSAVFLETLGLGLMIAGLAIRWVSIFTLGRFFTVDVAVQTDHTLIETGLYRHIRHPSYSGLLLTFLGLGVIFVNWLSLVVLVVPITLAVLNRIAKEESVLRDGLGASYAAYCSRTKRLVPGLF
jgi:protein-S-isoprenylcysteine O-methyltransferase